MTQYSYTTPEPIELSHAGSYTAGILEIGGRHVARIRGYERGAMEPDGGTGRYTPAGGHRVQADQDATWREAEAVRPLEDRIYASEATACLALERALGLRQPEPARHCGMCATGGITTVTRSSREWLDTSVAGGRWLPLCRSCYRELRAAYASGAQGGRIEDPDTGIERDTTRGERMAALREVAR